MQLLARGGRYLELSYLLERVASDCCRSSTSSFEDVTSVGCLFVLALHTTRRKKKEEEEREKGELKTIFGDLFTSGGGGWRPVDGSKGRSWIQDLEEARSGGGGGRSGGGGIEERHGVYHPLVKERRARICPDGSAVELTERWWFPIRSVDTDTRQFISEVENLWRITLQCRQQPRGQEQQGGGGGGEKRPSIFHRHEKCRSHRLNFNRVTKAKCDLAKNMNPFNKATPMERAAKAYAVPGTDI